MNIPKKYQERVYEVYHDEDGYWISLEDGWELEEGESLIHAYTVKDALAQLRETYRLNYKVVILYNDGKEEVIGYEKKEKAERIKAGIEKNHRDQIKEVSVKEWGCVRERGQECREETSTLY